jgi:hypothetical protein
MYTNEETILWLLEGELERQWHYSETGEDIDQDELVPRGEHEITPELRAEWEKYEAALLVALEKCCPTGDSNLMLNEDAAYNVFMTLNGEGVGIWDGRWSHLFSKEKIDNLSAFLENELSHFADCTGGGTLNNAFTEACYKTEESE